MGMLYPLVNICLQPFMKVATHGRVHEILAFSSFNTHLQLLFLDQHILRMGSDIEEGYPS